MRAVQALEPLGTDQWNSDTILAAIKASAEATGTKLGDAMQPIRIALTGGTVSEPVNELLVVVGRDAAIARLREAARTA
jgi:glutamyl-tRNA synthetase